MAAIWGAAIGAGAEILGGLKANSAARAASRDQMAFQREMADTQMQRRVADLKKAGLNPMLAYSLGGAAAPQGASYVPHNVGEAAVRGASSGAGAVSARQLATAQVSNVEAQTRLAQAQTLSSAAQARKADAESSILEAQSPQSAQQAIHLTSKLEQEVRHLTAMIEKAAEETRGLKQTHGHQGLMYPIQRQVERLVAETKASELPPKQVLEAIANETLKAERALKDPGTLSKYKSIHRDTLNFLEDRISGAWKSFKEYADKTRRPR